MLTQPRSQKYKSLKKFKIQTLLLIPNKQVEIREVVRFDFLVVPVPLSKTPNPTLLLVDKLAC